MKSKYSVVLTDKYDISYADREARPHNSTYTQGGVPFSADSYAGIESSLLRTNFSGNLPALRVAAKRYASVYRTETPKEI